MTSHLTFDELTEFASMERLDARSEANAAKVSKHLCECSDCRDLAAAVMLINDAFKNGCFDKTKKISSKEC